jgi:ketosteroid isomerase-like protein
LKTKGDLVKKIVVSIFVLLVCSVLMFSKSVVQSEKDSERYIVESERNWAESVATGDTSGIERYLADDFLGVSPEGEQYNKAKMVSDTKTAPKYFESNHLNQVKVRFYGDTAVAQGDESWVRRVGTPHRGKFVWTDTWIRRNGKWQIVAAEDLVVPEPEPNK